MYYIVCVYLKPTPLASFTYDFNKVIPDGMLIEIIGNFYLGIDITI